ncbi:hypothetical protein ACFU8Q_30605 [Streptomyces sp. NPDC057543]|uniref:hypothetical protein n=1 Tax=Streptomyces sp. NPDC057543 TaxID=3346163 RepID=UPI0036C99BED
MSDAETVTGGGARLLGYVLLGLGIAAIISVVFGHVAQRHFARPSPAIAAVSIVGYTGFLVGPPITGALAEATSLRTAMLVPLLLMAAMVLLARRLDSGPDGGWGHPAEQTPWPHHGSVRSGAVAHPCTKRRHSTSCWKISRRPVATLGLP